MTTAAIETAPAAQPTLEMGLSEAQHLAEQIKVATGGFVRQLGRLRELAVRFYEGRGFAAMGYATMEACARKEFGWDRVSFWRQLQAARIERELGVEIGNIPESHARELRRLPEGDRKAAYDEAKQDGKTTAADVREAVERRRAPSEPLPGTQEKPEEVCSHGLPVEGHCPECEDEYIGQQERRAENWPPGQELCIHGRDLINATCEECAEEPEQPEQLPGQDAENAQDAILSPSSAPPPLHVPARGAQTAGGRDKQATRETAGEPDREIGLIDAAYLRDNGLTLASAMQIIREVVTKSTAGPHDNRAQFCRALLVRARGQK